MFDYLENGDSLDDFLAGFPTLSHEVAIQVLEESKVSKAGSALK
jgi:hypothetical protein